MLDINPSRLAYSYDIISRHHRHVHAANLADEVTQAIWSSAQPGARRATPLITDDPSARCGRRARRHRHDQGGCSETSHPTTHHDPTFGA